MLFAIWCIIEFIDIDQKRAQVFGSGEYFEMIGLGVKSYEDCGKGVGCVVIQQNKTPTRKSSP